MVSNVRRNKDPLAVVKAIAEASAVLGAVAFVGGWSYLASYYRTFGLSPLELDIDVAVASTIALHVVIDYLSHFELAVTVFVLAATLATGLYYYVKGRKGWEMPRQIVVLILALLLFMTSYAALVRGRNNANQDMLSDSDTLPNIAFAIKDTRGTDKDAKPSDTANPGPSCVAPKVYGAITDCKLLVHLNDVYYFFQPIPATGVANLNLYKLADSDVLAVHIQRGLERNSIYSQGGQQ